MCVLPTFLFLPRISACVRFFVMAAMAEAAFVRFAYPLPKAGCEPKEQQFDARKHRYTRPYVLALTAMILDSTIIREGSEFPGRACVRCGCYEAWEGMTDECCWKRNPRKRKRCMFESGGTENEAAQDRLSAIPANQAVQRQDEPEM